MFKKNEYADMMIELVMSTKNLETKSIIPIEKDKRYDLSKKMDEQVYQKNDIDWETIN